MSRQRIAIIVVAILLVIFFLASPARLSSSWRIGLMQLSSPLVKLEHGVTRLFSSMGNALATRRRLALENDALRKRVKELERENMLLRDVKSENERLRRLLDFTNSRGKELIPARIIGRDTRSWYSSIIIDRGSGNGVTSGMPVVSEAGVVGKVIEAAPTVSKVLLIVDKRSRVGGIIKRTREMGLVEGTSFNTCRLNFLPRRTDARPGDRVLTSGLGGVYPKGLYIGEIERVYEGEYGLYKYADLSPGVNFATIEEVHVMIERGDAEDGSVR